MINSVKKGFGPHFTLDKGLREFGWDSVCATPRVTHETCHLIYSAKLPRPRLSNAKRIKESASTLFFLAIYFFQAFFLLILTHSLFPFTHLALSFSLLLALQ